MIQPSDILKLSAISLFLVFGLETRNCTESCRPPAPYCKPGSKKPCQCFNGASGFAACNRDGTAYMPCICINIPSCPDDMDCDNRVCGPDPVCGISCGTCPSDEICLEGQCVEAGANCPDEMDCTGLECGRDPVCNQRCGTCPPDEICEEGQCVERGEPERLKSRRYRLVWEDDFGDYYGLGNPCYDEMQTRCMTNSWWGGHYCEDRHPPEALAGLQNLNKCIWSVLDKYDWWTTAGYAAHHPSMVEVSDGHLRLTAALSGYDPPWDCNQSEMTSHCKFIAGAIESQPGPGEPDCSGHGFCRGYGRYEARAKVPSDPGAFPAVWIKTATSFDVRYAEFDIMERVGTSCDRALPPHGSAHVTRWDDVTVTNQQFHFVKNQDRFEEEFHIFAVEWEPHEVRFFINELEIGRYRVGEMSGAHCGNTHQPLPDQPVYIPDGLTDLMHFTLDVALQTQWIEDQDNFEPVTMVVDYVRFYERCEPDDNDPECMPRSSGSAEIGTDSGLDISAWRADDTKIIVGDFNGDGADDLILQPLRANGPATRLLLADGKGAFNYHLDITNSAGMSPSDWPADAYELIPGDFDGDGRTDLIVRPFSIYKDTYLLRGFSNGSFAHREVITSSFGMTGTEWAGQSSLAVAADFDGDGRDDLLLVGNGSAGSIMLRGCPHNGLSAKIILSSGSSISSTSWYTGIHQIHTGDFNGNGRADILFQATTTTGITRLMFSDGTGRFHPPINVTNMFSLDRTRWSASVSEVLIGDFNGNGRDDIVLRGRSATGATYLLLSQETGYFGNAIDISNSFWMNQILWAGELRRAYVGDFNGSGASDIILRPREFDEHGGHATYAMLGGANPDVFHIVRVITEAQVLSYGEWADSTHVMHVGDFDGDGVDDILLQGRSGQLFPIRDYIGQYRFNDNTYVLYLKDDLQP